MFELCGKMLEPCGKMLKQCDPQNVRRVYLSSPRLRTHESGKRMYVGLAIIAPSSRLSQPSRRSLSLHLSLRSSSITPRVRTSLTPDWGHATATRRCVVGNKDNFHRLLADTAFALSTRVQATRKISLFSIFRRIHRMDSQANTLCIVRTYHTSDCDNPPASCRCATAMRPSFVVMAQERPPCAYLSGEKISVMLPRLRAHEANGPMRRACARRQ